MKFYKILFFWFLSFVFCVQILDAQEKVKVIDYGYFSRQKNAISVKTNQIILVKEKTNYGALNFLNFTNIGNGGYRYVWYYQNDKSGNFTNTNSKTGTNLVFEKFIRIKTNRNGEDIILLKDDGGRIKICFETFQIVWSFHNWLYFRENMGAKKNTNKESYQFAVINTNIISTINYLDQKIEWIKEE